MGAIAKYRVWNVVEQRYLEGRRSFATVEAAQEWADIAIMQGKLKPEDIEVEEQ